MTDKSHKSPEALRAELGLPAARRGRGGGQRPQPAPAPPTVDAPLGGAAGEIDELFAIVQDNGYHIAPGGYAVQFDEAGRPRVSLSVYPPSVLGTDADPTDGQEQAGDAPDVTTTDGESDDTVAADDADDADGGA